MLKVNSKQARANIRAYIMDRTNAKGRDLEKLPETWEEVAHFIMNTFESEKRGDNMYTAGRISKQQLFEDWCSGLPSALDTCYYWNRSAVDDLAEILEESESKKARYTESQAEKMLTYLIYAELLRGCR